MKYIYSLMKINDGINDTLSKCAKNKATWDEDHITLSLLTRLQEDIRSFSNTSIDGIRPILLSVYKNKNIKNSANERKYGDIAFLVRRYFNDNSYVDGVGLLEAKRSYKSGKYEAIKYDQLEIMNANCDNHKLLLYVYPSIVKQNSKMDRLLACDYCCFPLSYSGLAVTQPSIISLKRKCNEHNKLHGDSVPLAYQIQCKYFEGFDLNYREAIIDDIRTGDGECDFVVNVAVGYSTETGMEQILLNRDIYEFLNE